MKIKVDYQPSETFLSVEMDDTGVIRKDGAVHIYPYLT